MGIELSTQSAKAIVLDLDRHDTASSVFIAYDREFPEYQTENGVLPNINPSIRRTSPFMLIQALEAVFIKLAATGLALKKVRALKIDCMQHALIFTDSTLRRILAALDPQNNLLQQIGPCLTRREIPIWEDSSTGHEVKQLEQKLAFYGGAAKLTANAAELRFPASQIIKWAAENPQEYQNTAHIMLLSAFVTSILTGKLAPVDTGDGWGTNLNSTDLKNPGWNSLVIQAAEELCGHRDLLPKLGCMSDFDLALGCIAPYFSQKYGFNPGVKILAGTGDNPATLAGSGVAVISLGSSYTVNGVMKNLVLPASRDYNVFGFAGKSAMALSCFTNGGKLHEYFLRKYLIKNRDARLRSADWENYQAACGSALLSADEKIMLPWLYAESVPPVQAGIFRENFNEENAAENIRALHISQVSALALHSGHLNTEGALAIAGGGSSSKFLRQLISDFFNKETFVIKNADLAAPFGCALSAAVHILQLSYQEAWKIFIRADESSRLFPIKENRTPCRILLERYRQLEEKEIMRRDKLQATEE
ncbi:MAG: hypothetical protein A2096_16865 [Spirochaetes bacterium GWF1_41_5]|nr:MAG: hypothetical protein A2096_16865 [Spirochaetes bacterium GWF1_41_5]